MWCAKSLNIINFANGRQPMVTRQPGTKRREKHLGKGRNVFVFGGGLSVWIEGTYETLD